VARCDVPGREGPVCIPFAGGAVRWAIAPVLVGMAGVWCWAVLRLAVEPAQSGPLEAAIVAGGWGLSLLPVHCVPASEAKPDRLTRAWCRRRSGGGSDRS
jgi:hypothetical protein